MKVFLGALVILVLLVLYLARRRPGPQQVSKAVLINLDSDTERFEYFMKQTSDFEKPERIQAVDGHRVEPGDYLTQGALKELRETETRGYRTKHHQLTRGAIGCYLSHLSVLRQIKPGEIFLVFEDDIDIRSGVRGEIEKILRDAPKNWDLILLGYNSYLGSDDELSKVRSFWGTCGYLITYIGAQKFLNESGDRFDCQIDTFMGWMAASGLLDVYALKSPIVKPSCKFASNIQNDVRVSFPDSFKYRDKILQLN